jgi:hypothetical protein
MVDPAGIVTMNTGALKTMTEENTDEKLDDIRKAMQYMRGIQ